MQAVARSVKIYLQTMEHMRTRLEQTPFCEMDEVKIEATAWGELERMFSIIEMHVRPKPSRFPATPMLTHPSETAGK